MIIPPNLHPGDTIGMVCPAGYMAPERAQVCIATLECWGYQVRLGRTMQSRSENYFSGTDEERLADLQEMLDDPSVRAVLCARGGYGLTRIIDRIDFSGFAASPKWVIGFSDITLLHAHIYANYKIATLHAPMAGAFNDGAAKGEYIGSLRWALTGDFGGMGDMKGAGAMEGGEGAVVPAGPVYSCAVSSLNRSGKAVGRLVGGNLALLAHGVGTPSDIKTKGKILFLEDVGEYLYNIDRMLHQLDRNGKLDRLAGLVIGGFTELKDTERPFGSSVEEIIRDVVGEYEYPVCFGFPVGHQKENVALRIGVRYELEAGEEVVRLRDLGE